MKKIAVSGLMMVALASCQMMTPTTPSDYTSLYNANVKAELKNSEDFFRSLFGKAQEADGKISTKLDLQSQEMKMLINASSDFAVLGEPSGSSHVSFINPRVHYEMDNVSQNINKDEPKTIKVESSAKNLDIINSLSGVFAQFTNPSFAFKEVITGAGKDVTSEGQKFTNNLITALQEFSGKWIALPQNEMQLEQNKIAAKILSLTVADFENYLTKYQIYTPISDKSVTNGSKVTFDVELNHQNTLNLLVDFIKDTTGEEMSESDKNHLLETLKKIYLKGTLTFDTKNPIYTEALIKIRPTESEFVQFGEQEEGNVPEFKFSILRDTGKIDATLSSLASSWKKNNGSVVVSEGDENAKFTFASQTKDSKTNFELKGFGPDMNMTGDSEKLSLTEMLVLNGEFDNGVIKSIDGTLITPFLISGKLSYKHNEGLNAEGSFMGKKVFNLVHKIENQKHTGTLFLQDKKVANWMIDVTGDMLNGLSIYVDNIAKYSSYYNQDVLTTDNKPLLVVNLERKGNDEFARGDAVITLGDMTASADIAIQAIPKQGKYGFILTKVTLPAIFQAYSHNMLIPTYVEFFAESNTKDTNKKVEPPTDIISSHVFAQKMEEVMERAGDDLDFIK